jgi:hypothetical protein
LRRHAAVTGEETAGIGVVLCLLGAVAVLVGWLLATLAVHAPRFPPVGAAAPARVVSSVAALGVFPARSRITGALGGGSSSAPSRRPRGTTS